MRPVGCVGVCVSRLSSMKMNWLGELAQTRFVEVPAAPTRNGLNSNKVPLPLSGVKSFENADMRKVLVEPGPELMTLALTFQLPPVSPAFCTGGESVPLVVKLMTLESKVKSPWNPIWVVVIGSITVTVVGTVSALIVAMGKAKVMPGTPSGSIGFGAMAFGAAGTGSGG